MVNSDKINASAPMLPVHPKDLSLAMRPVRSVLKLSSGIIHPHSPVLTADSVTLVTTAIAAAVATITSAGQRVSPNGTPTQGKMSVRWRDKHAEFGGARGGMLGCLDECREFDVPDEEREWKKSGKVKKWKVKLRLLRVDFRTMLQAKKKKILMDIRKKMVRKGTRAETEEKAETRTTVRKANQMEQVARFMEDKARQEEWLVENAKMRKRRREMKQKLMEQETSSI